VPDKRFIYKGGKFPDPGIDPVCYSPGFFQIELELYVFYELRRKNGIEPARINQRQGFGERLSKYCVNKI
jgi:hypothetical protein